MNNTQLHTSVQKVQQLVRSNLVGVIISSVALGLGLTGASTWNVWNTSQNLKVVVERQAQSQDMSSQLIYLDEVLTMSANMLVSTGQTKWEKRYQENTALFDKVAAEFFKDIPASEKETYQQLDVATKQLFAMEAQAFKLVKERNLAAASGIFSGEQYGQQKKIYASMLQAIIASIKNEVNSQTLSQRRALEFSIALALLSLGLSAVTGLGIILAVRGYIRDRELAQDALQASQDNLLIVNGTLEKEAQQRQQQEQLIQQENKQLQQDIGELLDVVSEIESGNLTIQAQVNDRATGLVGDTLNRLVEELGKTLRRVAVAAQRVEKTGQSQKNITTIVTNNIDRQTESVEQVLLLTKAMRQSAQNTVQQLADTNKSLVVLQSAVADGQSTITTLDRDIDVLQVGSDRIVQEIKTLGEFVGLTDRFVQDQGDIVTQTQILALNAALVAARAAEQRDPNQFTIVAREFESIATQVSQLAQQTNEGLTSLEQRSSQIHRVVSDVNTEVQQLGGLVNSFTQGVKQTREVFIQVQSVTEQTVESGKNVAIVSQQIVGATDKTVVDIESITAVAQQISQQAQDAQRLGDQLNILSQDLLDNIQVFQLPPAEEAIEPELVSQLVTL